MYFSLTREPGNRHRPTLELSNCKVCLLFENIFKIMWNLPKRILRFSFPLDKGFDVKIEVV